MNENDKSFDIGACAKFHCASVFHADTGNSHSVYPTILKHLIDFIKYIIEINSFLLRLVK